MDPKPVADSKLTEPAVLKDSHDEVPFDQSEALKPAVNRRLLMKTDLVVLPCLVISMTLAFLDKNALGFAAIFGLRTDANLKGQEYSWLGSIFYFGYLAMELPSMWLITKVPIGKYISACLILWGSAICLMAACHNFAGLATIRVLLGIFEAALLPCMLVLNSTWYRREEQPLRTALWHNTFAGVFGGILSTSSSSTEPSLFSPASSSFLPCRIPLLRPGSSLKRRRRPSSSVWRRTKRVSTTTRNSTENKSSKP
ncbi:major facilitator superfamily transporter [Colletotrichum asianum]